MVQEVGLLAQFLSVGFESRSFGLDYITHRPRSSSFFLPYRILHMNPKKELLWGLWVGIY